MNYLSLSEFIEATDGLPAKKWASQKGRIELSQIQSVYFVVLDNKTIAYRLSKQEWGIASVDDFLSVCINQVEKDKKSTGH